MLEDIGEDAVDCVVVSIETRTESDELEELGQLLELDEDDFSVTFGMVDSFSDEAVAGTSAAARPAAFSKIEVGTRPECNRFLMCSFFQ